MLSVTNQLIYAQNQMIPKKLVNPTLINQLIAN